MVCHTFLTPILAQTHSKLAFCLIQKQLTMILFVLLCCLQPERIRHRADRVPSRYDNRSPDVHVPDSHYNERRPLDKPQGYSKPSTEHYGATLPIGMCKDVIFVNFI